MRAYYFGNFYLSSIQQGIQALHVTTEMYNKYPNLDLDGFDLREWAEKHKTVILLNGGMAFDLRYLVTLFDTKHNPYCWSYFCEEEAALEGSITSVGIVLPEKIYAGAAILRENRWTPNEFATDPVLDIPVTGQISPETVTYTKFEMKLMFTMNKCGMAS